MPIPRVATYLIEDLSPALLSQETRRVYDLLDKNPSAKPKKFRSCPPMYELTDGRGYTYLVLVEDDEVTYFVRHHDVPGLPFRAGRQVLLARLASTFLTNQLPQKIFFSVLLPKYGTIVADTAQTDKGRRFWISAIAEAFRRGKYVYFVDMRNEAGPPVVTLLPDTQAVLNVKNDIWGTSALHDATFAAISTIRIPDA